MNFHIATEILFEQMLLQSMKYQYLPFEQTALSSTPPLEFEAYVQEVYFGFRYSGLIYQ